MLKDSISDHNNIDLFDRYLDGVLSPSELADFDNRLKSDKAFASDFKIYAFSINGLIREQEEEDMDFGVAMHRIDKASLLRAIGKEEEEAAGSSGEPPVAISARANKNTFRNWMTYAAAIAVVVVTTTAGMFIVDRSNQHRLDEIIVAYNYIPAFDRGSGQHSDESIEALESAYRSAPTDDLQTQEDAGMRLAMAYLKIHDRRRAIQLLTEMDRRFATDDPDFAEHCQLILSQLE